MTAAQSPQADALAPPAPHLSVIVPTRNERANIEPLLRALAAALSGIAAEVVVADDSSDGTADEARRLAADLPFPVRVATRTSGETTVGLGTAVLRGARVAGGAYLCVMDADLQHPPALVSRLLATAEAEGADVVIASRYVRGGAAGGLSNGFRHLVSRSLGLSARLLFPRRVGRVRDPMSGYFLFRRSLLDGVTLDPIGFKILLELLVRCRPARVREIPFAMAPRHAGESKAGLREATRYARHLLTLRFS